MAIGWFKLQIYAGWFDREYMTSYTYRHDAVGDLEEAAQDVHVSQTSAIVDQLRKVWPESVFHARTQVRQADDPSNVLVDAVGSEEFGLAPESHLPHEIAAVLVLRRTDSAPFTRGCSFVGPLGADAVTDSGYWSYPDFGGGVDEIWNPLAEAMAVPTNGNLRFDIWSNTAQVGVPVGLISLSNRFGRQRRRRRGSSMADEVWPLV